MSLEQINIPFPKYFIDKIRNELESILGREVDMDDISAYIFLMAVSEYFHNKEMK